MSVFGIRTFGVLTLLTVLAVSLPAQAADASKMGIVDMQRVVANSRDGKAAEKKLNDLLTKKREQFKPQEEQFQKLRGELESQQFVLSPEALEERQIELAQLKSKLERDLQAAQEEVQIERRKMLAPLLRRIQEVIAAIGKTEGFVMIVERQQPGVLYFNESLDITEMVIKNLNDKS